MIGVSSSSADWFLGWHWIWVFVLLGVMVTPVIFAGRFRLLYVATMCTIIIGIIIFFWLRNYDSREGCMFNFARYTPTLGERRSLEFFSSAGRIGLAYRYLGSSGYTSPDDWKGGLDIGWGRAPGRPEEYPAWRDPLFRGGGFQLTWFNEAKIEKLSGLQWHIVLQWRGVCVPNWFAILLFMAPPVLWMRRFMRRKKIRRWIATGRCERCGYDLRGNVGKCSECGTPIPARKAVAPSDTPLPAN